MKYKGIIYTVASALLFGFTPVLASFTYDMGSNPQTLTFYRNLLVVPVLLVVMLIKRINFRLTKKEVGAILLIGILGRGITTLMLYSSYEYIGVGTSTTLHFLYPVFVALICRVFYKERLGASKLLTLLLAITGILFFTERGHSSAVTGIILAVMSGLTYAFYMVGMEKQGLKDMNPSKLSFYMAAAVAGAMLAYNIPTRQIHFSLPPKAFLYTFIIALCTSFLAVSLLQLGIKYLNATTAAIFCLFEPVSCAMAGWLFLGEKLTAAKITGSLIILAAVTLLMLSDRKKGHSCTQEA